MEIPKLFMTGIRVPYGPLKGALAEPCNCGEPVVLGEDTLYLIQWNNGPLMFCHEKCVRQDEEEEDDDA